VSTSPRVLSAWSRVLRSSRRNIQRRYGPHDLLPRSRHGRGRLTVQLDCSAAPGGAFGARSDAGCCVASTPKAPTRQAERPAA
jgi:hypothetical protein